MAFPQSYCQYQLDSELIRETFPFPSGFPSRIKDYIESGDWFKDLDPLIREDYSKYDLREVIYSVVDYFYGKGSLEVIFSSELSTDVELPDAIILRCDSNYPSLKGIVKGRQMYAWNSEDTYTRSVSPIFFKPKCDSVRPTTRKLIAYAEEVFDHQKLRDFMFALLFTESSMQLCLVSRSGVHYSQNVDFKQDFKQDSHAPLIHSLLYSLSTEVNVVGPITTPSKRSILSLKYNNGKEMKVKLLDVVYTTKKIPTGGTCCWKASKYIEGNSKQNHGTGNLIVKRSWVDENLTSLTLVQTLKKVRSKTQLPTLLAWEIGRQISELPGVKYEKGVNKTLYVLVLKDAGSSLVGCANHEMILYGIRDAALGHQYLLHKLGILHLDINPGNILVKPDPRGRRYQGVLTDFDKMRSVERDKVMPVVGWEPRYALYRSLYILQERRALRSDPTPEIPNTHMDDLESLFWIYIALGLANADGKRPLPVLLRSWSFVTHHNLGEVHGSKKDFLYGDPTCRDWNKTVGKTFGPCYLNTINQLRSFFQNRYDQPRDKDPIWSQEFEEKSKVDYEIFLDKINHSIGDLHLNGAADDYPASSIPAILSPTIQPARASISTGEGAPLQNASESLPVNVSKKSKSSSCSGNSQSQNASPSTSSNSANSENGTRPANTKSSSLNPTVERQLDSSPTKERGVLTQIDANTPRMDVLNRKPSPSCGSDRSQSPSLSQDNVSENEVVVSNSLKRTKSIADRENRASASKRQRKD